MFEFLFSNKESDFKKIDDSFNYLKIANNYKDDPTTLIYLVNYLVKRYTLARSKYLYELSNIPSLEKVLPSPNTFLNFRHLYQNAVYNSITLDIRASSIITGVWSHSGMVRNIKAHPVKIWQFTNNHFVSFYFPMCISIVTENGNHSISAGILNNSIGKTTLDYYYDCSKSIHQMKTTGNTPIFRAI